MEKLKAMAKKIDTVLKVVWILLSVAASIVVIATAILGIGYMAGLPMDGVAVTGSVNIECFKFKLAQPVELSKTEIFSELGSAVLYVVAVTIFCWCVIRTLRKILKPMKEGTPFTVTVSENIKTLGKVYIIGGFVIQWMENLTWFVNQRALELVIKESVKTEITFEVFDSSMVFVGILVIMLSYVFSYGAELQQQADETL